MTSPGGSGHEINCHLSNTLLCVQILEGETLPSITHSVYTTSNVILLHDLGANAFAFNTFK